MPQSVPAVEIAFQIKPTGVDGPICPEGPIPPGGPWNEKKQINIA